MSSWISNATFLLFRRIPRAARSLLWQRTPAERLREYRVCRGRTEVAAQLRQRLQAGPDPGILFLPAQTWFSTQFQRPQQLARAMAKAGAPVVYCEPWAISHSVAVSSVDGRHFSGVKDIGERLHLLRWPRSGLRELLRLVQPDAVLMIFPVMPTQGGLVPKDSTSRVIYEILDNHELGDASNVTWIQQHKHWVKNADVLVASADDLLAELRPQRPDTLLLPNAVTLEDWESTVPAELPIDMAGARRAERVIVYYGAMAEWFDWPLWIHAAKARPNWSFVLIGPAYDGDVAAVHARAAAAPNIYYLGPKRYDELPRYMQFVDVATIPFVLNAITHACSPVKLFEYMAVGKPIVTTAMREVLKYKSVLVAQTQEDFVRRLDEAIAKKHDPHYLALLRAEAEANTWKSRALALNAALAETRARRGGNPRRAQLLEHA